MVERLAVFVESKKGHPHVLQSVGSMHSSLVASADTEGDDLGVRYSVQVESDEPYLQTAAVVAVDGDNTACSIGDGVVEGAGIQEGFERCRCI